MNKRFVVNELKLTSGGNMDARRFYVFDRATRRPWLVGDAQTGDDCLRLWPTRKAANAFCREISEILCDRDNPQSAGTKHPFQPGDK